MPDIAGYTDAVAARSFNETLSVVPAAGNRIAMGPPAYDNLLNFQQTWSFILQNVARGAGIWVWKEMEVLTTGTTDLATRIASLIPGTINRNDPAVGSRLIGDSAADFAVALGRTVGDAGATYRAVLAQENREHLVLVWFATLTADGLVPDTVARNGQWYVYGDAADPVYRFTWEYHGVPAESGVLLNTWVIRQAGREKLAGEWAGNYAIFAPLASPHVLTSGGFQGVVTASEQGADFQHDGSVRFRDVYTVQSRWDARLEAGDRAIRWRNRAWVIESVQEFGRRKWAETRLRSVL